MTTLSITNLYISSLGKPIVKGVDLTIRQGELHFLMGPNGAGKSTVAHAVMGHPRYEVREGTIRLGRKNILRLSPDIRARLGLFLGFQHPMEVEGVKMFEFLHTAHRRRFASNLPVFQFRRRAHASMTRSGWDTEFLDRYLNKDFSGGEKKRSEVLQLSILKPKIAILDEFDSGLDVGAVKLLSKEIERVREEGTGLLLITHNPHIAKYLTPDVVHIMVGGKIIQSGGKELVTHIEQHGYPNKN